VELRSRGIRGDVVDSYRYAAAIFSKVVADGYIGMVKTVPELYKLIYDRAERVPVASGFRVWAAEYTARRLHRLIVKMRPSVVVCTHAFPCGVMSAYKRLYNSTIPVMGIVTDFVVHPFWIYPNIDAYAVGTPEMRATMIERGIDPARVQVDGIPVDGRFGIMNETRIELRERLGLAVDRPIALLMGGGLGMGPIEQATESLATLGSKAPDAVVIVGRNAHLERRVAERSAKFPYETRVLGFVDNVYDYMHASDVLISKPGGLTTSEALAAELPMIIVRPLPGQEERNATYLTTRGAALRAHDASELARLTARVVGDGVSALELRDKMSHLRRPLSASTISDRIQNMIVGERELALR
jgi:processive 1,2-diacylglycerol beta-glucosyltransferase